MSDLAKRELFKGVLGTLAARHGPRGGTQPPNFVCIICDDLGYGDLGYYGSRIYTPRLNQMASEGSISAISTPLRRFVLRRELR